MFNFFSSKDKREKKPAGPAFYILTALRVCNIIALLDIVVASWIMLVMTVKTSNFFFFDGVSHFITSTISIFLILSELSLFKPYFRRNWPLLGPESTFLFLGIAMIAVGFNVLGNLNKEATSIHKLGLPMWRVVISSGILSSVFGFFTIAANYWYGHAESTQTARQIRSRYVEQGLPKDTYFRPLSLNDHATTYNGEEPLSRREKFMSRLPFTNKRESQRFPVISRPYQADEEYGAEKLSRSSSISSLRKDNYPEVVEDRMSPIANGIERPPTALHPFNRNEHRYSMSQYSTTTNGRRL